MKLVIDIDENTYNDIEKGKVYTSVRDVPQESVLAIRHGTPLDNVLDKIRAEIKQLPIKTRTNWDGCCPDIDYPEIEYVDVTKATLLEIIDKYKAESEDKEWQ